MNITCTNPAACPHSLVPIAVNKEQNAAQVVGKQKWLLKVHCFTHWTIIGYLQLLMKDFTITKTLCHPSTDQVNVAPDVYIFVLENRCLWLPWQQPC